MNRPALIMRVRFKSALSFDEVNEVVDRRAPEFEALAGLLQKYYLQDPVTGAYAGLYLWESADALDEYRDSDLRASIAEAYQSEGEPDIEVYRVLKTLRDDEAQPARG
jgi:heme-degrading monooxygenase HmoA